MKDDEKKIVTVSLNTGPLQYLDDVSLVDFVDHFSRLLESIPPEFRSSAQVVWEPDYEGGRDVAIYYQRPETNQEAEERAAMEAKYEEDAKRRKFDEYLKLKKLFQG